MFDQPQLKIKNKIKNSYFFSILSLIKDHGIRKKYSVNNYSTDYYVLSKKPLIIVTHWETYHPDIFCELFKDQKVYFIFFLWWSHELKRKHRTLIWKYKKIRKKYPLHEFIFLTNTNKEKEILGNYNIPCDYCNHNAFLDEKLYKIEIIRKKYDAIYTARVLPFKRHHLASNIDNLALLTYDVENSTSKYFEKVRNKLKKATWLNFNNKKKYSLIHREQISKCINQAKVGLCLSAEEGANYASVEYLLCGLPIVSTKSAGGRDVFFDDKFVKIVSDSPESIKSGVDEMIHRKISPNYIRNQTIKKMLPHRKRFIKIVQNIYDAENVKKNFKKEWSKVFRNRLLKGQKVSLLKKYVDPNPKA